MAASDEIRAGRLYGVITPILPDGEFVKCEPVFVDCWGSKKTSAYYLGIKPTPHEQFSKSGISHFERVDINVYGNEVFLPASRKKINDGKEYFIVFQPTKNHTVVQLQHYHDFPTVLATREDCYSRVLNVGILFPNKFVAVITDREMSEEALQFAINQY